MPPAKTRRAAGKDKHEGKAASTQAGEYVKEEIEQVREGAHGVKSTKQAIAIGLSKARRDGVDVAPPGSASKATKKKAAQDKAAATSKSRCRPRARPVPRKPSRPPARALPPRRRWGKRHGPNRSRVPQKTHCQRPFDGSKEEGKDQGPGRTQGRREESGGDAQACRSQGRLVRRPDVASSFQVRMDGQVVGG